MSDRQMVNNSIQFFNKDARDVFLAPKSVDLFISHFPFFQRGLDVYGGDKSLQIQNETKVGAFFASILKSIQNMELALKDNGSMVLILPNSPRSFRIIADIAENTKLFSNRIIFWNFEDPNDKKTKIGDETNLILHLTHLNNLPYDIKGLDSFVVKSGFGPSAEDIEIYGNAIVDALPQEISDLLVSIFSKEGDTVADIFAGSGTVAISALKNNRKAIYNDVSDTQFEIAKKRVSDIIGYGQEIATIEREKEEIMTKEEAVSIMMESINADNLALGLQAGLDETELKNNIEQSQPSLGFMMSNIYDKLQAGGAIA